jgi:hypothetical protein
MTTFLAEAAHFFLRIAFRKYQQINFFINRTVIQHLIDSIFAGKGFALIKRESGSIIVRIAP